jgi:hypothetical protein
LVIYPVTRAFAIRIPPERPIAPMDSPSPFTTHSGNEEARSPIAVRGGQCDPGTAPLHRPQAPDAVVLEDEARVAVQEGVDLTLVLTS